MKVKYFFKLFLIDVTDNTVQNNTNIVFFDYSLWVSEMNESSVIKDRREKLKILCTFTTHEAL